MELKKSPKVDLQNKKGIFSLVGLVISLLLMIGMFSWSQAELQFEVVEQEQVVIDNDVVEITRQEPPKVQPPKVQAPVISDILDVVKNTVELDDTSNLFSADVSEDTEVIEIEDIETVEEIIEEEVPVLIAEKMPTFQGGDVSVFRNWVLKNVVYPAIAEENNITGTVTCSFVVEKDGSVSNIEILRSPDKSLSDESTRVLKKSPKWSPGEQRGKAVRVKVIIPISFTFAG